MAAPTMSVQDFEEALSELETRLDRLRALYENWFRGYEKSEPAVARKDVERRVYALRKELPRNTALRFRYHQLYQRYTTLATYWQRTARQIEEGTYRLQLQRIRRRVDTRRSSREPRLGEDTPNPSQPLTSDIQGLAPPSHELDLDETLDVNKLLDELDLDQVARAIDLAAPRSEPGPGHAASLAPASRPALAPRVSLFAAAKPTSAPAASPRGSDSDAAANALLDQASARPSLPPDMQTLPPRAPLAGASMAPSKGLFKAPRLSPPPAVAPPDPSIAPRAPSAAAGATGASAGRPRVPAPPPPGALPGTSAHAPAGQVPPAPRIPGPTPPAVPRAAPTPAAVPSRVPAPAPVPSAVPGGAPARPPSPPRPAAQAAQPPPGHMQAGAPAPARSPAPPTAGPSEQRLRRIYDEYAAARRNNHEGEVRYETLVSSIHKMLPDLHKKYQGKQIDFEIVLKDGRVGLKPKAL